MEQWINWVKQLQAIGQAGKAYSKDGFDIERFEQLTHISQQMFSELGDASVEQV
ncbi:NUDIX hydrolase N-terminal domain-containing protein [Vibrio profundum]|uniref:NUDIX hydrolase N-terminal domain-containing protein n=1 Tax=Vibrio profundum TaxID=2910247 RepID=UPI003D0F45B7